MRFKKMRCIMSAAALLLALALPPAAFGQPDGFFNNADGVRSGDGGLWNGMAGGNDGGSAQGTFTGSIAAVGEGVTTCHFFYLGHDNGMTKPTGAAAANISFAAQDGTLAGAMKYHTGYGRTDVTVESGEYAGYVVMNTKIAIAHLNFTTDGTSAYTGSLTMGGTGIFNTLSVNPDGSTFTGSGDEGITIGSGDGETGDRYVMLIPTETTDVLNVSFTGDATGGTTFLSGIRENKFYGMSNAIEVTVEAAGPVHEYVDLGLPNGTLWATCNVGADSPEDYGWYFMWGSVTEGGDPNCSWANCPFTNGTYSTSNKKVFTKYIPTGKSEYWAGDGDPDNKTVLDLEDDAARANWVGDWRTPTTEEWQELYGNTTNTWVTSYNGKSVSGRLFKSKNDDSKELFLPAAGYRNGTNLTNAVSNGYYWSSSLFSSNPNNAHRMYFYAGLVTPQSYNTRYSGCTVRPVR